VWFEGCPRRRGPVDEIDGPSLESASPDEVGKAVKGQIGSAASGDAQEQEGDHGGEDLKADGVLGTAEKALDVEMLLDPAEEQLDLPAFAVEGGDLEGGAVEVVGQQDDEAAVVTAQGDVARAAGRSC
jgi:hypothetical protein